LHANWRDWDGSFFPDARISFWLIFRPVDQRQSRVFIDAGQAEFSYALQFLSPYIAIQIRDIE